MCRVSKAVCLSFIDNKKAFDSVELKAILSSLEKLGMDRGYIDALAEIQNGPSTAAMLHREGKAIPICKGVRQGDTI